MIWKSFIVLVLNVYPIRKMVKKTLEKMVKKTCEIWIIYLIFSNGQTPKVKTHLQGGVCIINKPGYCHCLIIDTYKLHVYIRSPWNLVIKFRFNLKKTCNWNFCWQRWMYLYMLLLLECISMYMYTLFWMFIRTHFG